LGVLTPEESWLYLLKNMATFAGKPEEMGSRHHQTIVAVTTVVAAISYTAGAWAAWSRLFS
jgi:hypothetical protein